MILYREMGRAVGYIEHTMVVYRDPRHTAVLYREAKHRHCIGRGHL